MVTDQQIDAAVPANGIPNRALTNAVLKDIRDSAGESGRMVVEVTPTSGQSVPFADNNLDMVLVLNGEETIASLELVLPPERADKGGQLCRVISYIGVDELTITGAASILGAPPQVFEGDSFAITRVEEDRWACFR